ncbi:hypothetical protein JCM3774_002996 [Rhodotorula dairenensis]
MPTEFASSELQQALAEIPWGYRGYTLLPDPPAAAAAAAEIRLLDPGDHTATASCTTRGWTLLHCTRDIQQPDQPFDTLDDLMLAVSPAFEKLRIEKLLERLADVANAAAPPATTEPRWAPFLDQ